jgi:YesN/AraC family two-component response regulator
MKPMQDVQDILLSIAYLYMSKTGIDNFNNNDKINIIYTNMANRLIDILLSYFDWFNYLNIYPNPNEQIRERFHSISSYCQKNYMNKITISQLAKAEHINENYFSQFLLKSSFQGFSNMLNYIRCFEAETLMLLTDLPANEISCRCGFSDIKYYYRHFKKWWGTTPHQYKNSYKRYVETPSNYKELSHAEAFEIIKDCIAAYHTRKSIGTVQNDIV